MTENQPPIRHLPAKKSSLMLRAATPPYEELVSMRRLGQTNIPTPTNSTPIYCHLPAPLPSDIFSDFRSATTHYYLLRRLPDNYVSATCLFRAVFPYADADEKIREFRYLRGIFKAQFDEVTGDVWISGKQAMKLAEDYGVRRWIGALLDPRGVETISPEIIDLTLDDSDEEEMEVEQEQAEEDSEEEEKREDEAREKRQREDDKTKEKEASEAREEERMRGSKRGVEARERKKEREQSHGQAMQMAVMI